MVISKFSQPSLSILLDLWGYSYDPDSLRVFILELIYVPLVSERWLFNLKRCWQYEGRQISLHRGCTIFEGLVASHSVRLPNGMFVPELFFVSTIHNIWWYLQDSDLLRVPFCPLIDTFILPSSKSAILLRTWPMIFTSVCKAPGTEKGMSSRLLNSLLSHSSSTSTDPLVTVRILPHSFHQNRSCAKLSVSIFSSSEQRLPSIQAYMSPF